MADLIVTLVGADHPGIVESVAQPVAAHGGNWLESRMAHLAGKFAGIVRVEVPAEKVRPLTEALAALDRVGLKVVVEAGEPEPAPVQPQYLELDVVGTDRPGIVRDFSRVLVAHGANIEELTTDRPEAAMSGAPLFRARARVRLAASASTAALRGELEKVASDLMVEVKLLPPPKD
jgi:glycine cleavage system regulatory protein